MWKFGEQIELPLGGNSLASNDPATTTIHGQAKEPTLRSSNHASSSVRNSRSDCGTEESEREDK